MILCVKVEGRLKGGESDPHFEWIHAPKKGLYEPQEPYDPKGAFGWFSNYNVEVRDRVKCISALHGMLASLYSSYLCVSPLKLKNQFLKKEERSIHC